MNTEVIERIASGEFDGDLVAIGEALTARTRYLRSVKSAENKRKLVPGTKVRIAREIKPRYLLGLTGTIVPRASSRSGYLMFEFDEASYPYASRRFDRVVGVPANSLEAI